MSQGSSEMPYELVNPYAFEPPIAPPYRGGPGRGGESDRVAVEGVGGWRVAALGTSL